MKSKNPSWNYLCDFHKTCTDESLFESYLKGPNKCRYCRENKMISSRRKQDDECLKCCSLVIGFPTLVCLIILVLAVIFEKCVSYFTL
jgi:uncharacterized protein (DUF983 family)